MRKLPLLLGFCLAAAPALADGAKEGTLVHGLKVGQTAGLFGTQFDQAEVGRFESKRFGALSFGTIAVQAADRGRREQDVQIGPGNTGLGGLQMGGYLAYSLSDYSIDARWHEDGLGAQAGGVGASYGSNLGMSTSYSVRLGAGFGESGFFSQNSAHGETGNSEVNLSVSLIHVVTPNMYLNGTAGAARMLGGQEPGFDSSSRDYRIGAGVGLRF